MANFDDLLKNLPPETKAIFDAFWAELPGSDRKNFIDLIQAFPSEANLLQLLFKMGANQVKMTFGQKQSLVIVGPANVGKSTLYNQLVANKADQAEVSPLPGTTKAVQTADAGIFAVADTPGADAVGEVGEKERQAALKAAADADFLIIMFDAVQGIKQTELELYRTLSGYGKPFVVVLNKTDLLKKNLDAMLEHTAKSLSLNKEQIIPISAKTGDHIPVLLRTIAVAEPGIVAALGRALPQYRWQLAWRAIASAASVSAAVALTPLPVIDFVPLAVTQAVMVLGIARIYDYKITMERARELVISFGLGFLGRTIFYELSKLGGVPGWLLSAAVATSMTVAMGYAAVIWFERGERLTSDSVKQLSENLTKIFLQNLKSTLKRKPNKKGLQSAVEEMLSHSAMGLDREVIEAQFEDVPEIKLDEDEEMGTG